MANTNSAFMNKDLTECYPRQWVTRYADYLYTYAMIRINDEELAKDLVQETFLAGLENLGKFEGRSSEKTWLTAILKNKIYDVYRKKSAGLLKRLGTENESTDGFFRDADGHWLTEQQPVAFGIETGYVVESKELNHILQGCIEKLPALWLSIFAMKHQEDLSTEIICNNLQLTRANFWVILHRAKINLRACLQKNWY